MLLGHRGHERSGHVSRVRARPHAYQENQDHVEPTVAHGQVHGPERWALASGAGSGAARRAGYRVRWIGWPAVFSRRRLARRVR
jgi:hypothetical protein